MNKNVYQTLDWREKKWQALKESELTAYPYGLGPLPPEE